MRTGLQIAFRNLEPSEAIAARIRQRVAWLERFFSRIISCRVIVEAPHKHHHSGNIYHIRVNLRVPGKEIVVSRNPEFHEAHKDMYVAIRDAFDEVRRELEDHARRRRVEVKSLVTPPRGSIARLIHGDGGYGFLQTEDGRELYFHSNSVLGRGFDRLEKGMEVRYAEEMGEDGPQASTVEILGTGRRKKAA
jgi:ribosomal subunit interface protein